MNLFISHFVFRHIEIVVITSTKEKKLKQNKKLRNGFSFSFSNFVQNCSHTQIHQGFFFLLFNPWKKFLFLFKTIINSYITSWIHFSTVLEICGKDKQKMYAINVHMIEYKMHFCRNWKWTRFDHCFSSCVSIRIKLWLFWFQFCNLNWLK